MSVVLIHPINLSPALCWEDPCWGCESIISPCKEPDNVITFCQHLENEPLSFRHNYGSGSIIGDAGEWPAEITLCFYSISLSFETTQRSLHPKARREPRGHSAEFNIGWAFQVCCQKGLEVNIRINARSFSFNKAKTPSDKTEIFSQVKLLAVILLWVLCNDNMKLWLSGGTRPTLMTLSRMIGSTAFPHQCAFPSLQIRYQWVPRVFQFTESQKQIRRRLQWHYLQRRPAKAEDIQESVRQPLPHTAEHRGKSQNTLLPSWIFFHNV